MTCLIPGPISQLFSITLNVEKLGVGPYVAYEVSNNTVM